jgi:hypothetical protein
MVDKKKEKIYPIGTLVKLRFFPYPAGYIKSHFRGTMVLELFKGSNRFLVDMNDVVELKSTDAE